MTWYRQGSAWTSSDNCPWKDVKVRRLK